MSDTSVRIVRSAERPRTDIGWLDSRHSFSFGPHWDPSNTHHGLLVVSNDDVVLPGTGFTTHPHRDMEIVTWVLDGELEHRDTLEHRGLIYPGLAQRMSAGTGIWHSEMNPSGDEPVRFVQMWVLPDTESLDPSYEQLDVNPELDGGGLVPVASGKGHDAAISIRQRGAALWAGRLAADERVSLPDARHVHLYVARGRVTLDVPGLGPEGEPGPETGTAVDLGEGDAARLVSAGTPPVTAGPEGAEVLVWETA